MIVITTPTGQIGRQVLGNLLESGEQLRVIARDPSQLPAVLGDIGEVSEASCRYPSRVPAYLVNHAGAWPARRR